MMGLGLHYAAIYMFVLPNIILIGAVKVSNCTNGIIALSCPSTAGCLLSVNSSTFGHGDPLGGAARCPARDADCRTGAPFVRGMCHGQVECTVRVPQERPRDQCHTVSSYLTVEFECICVTCPTLPAVPFGRVSYSSPYLTAGTTALYSCQTGFPVVGPRSRTCQVDGRWTGVQPACSIPVSTCPPSRYPRRSFGIKCYEFVTSFAPWTAAQNDCRSRNGSLSTPDGATELAYLGWQLEELGLYNYVWVADSRTDEEVNGDEHACVELYKSDVGGGVWLMRNTTCSYMSAYLCLYDELSHTVRNCFTEIEQPWAEDASNVHPSRNTKAGVGLGIGVGIVLILLCLFCIICRENSIDEEPAEHNNKHPIDHDFNPESDLDIYDDTTYDDTLPECDVTPSSSPDLHHYAQVDKKSKVGHVLRPTAGAVPEQGNYDEVYAQMAAVVPEGGGGQSAGSTNTYENITVHHSLVGSLKSRLTRPWRQQPVATVRIEDDPPPSPPHQPQLPPSVQKARKKSVLRQKPQPAPKPVIRRSALEEKLEAIREGRSRQRGWPNPGPAEGESGGSGQTPALRWAGSRPGRQEGSSAGVDNEGLDEQFHSGIEIVENDIYDSDGQGGQLTEL